MWPPSQCGLNGGGSGGGGAAVDTLSGGDHDTVLLLTGEGQRSTVAARSRDEVPIDIGYAPLAADAFAPYYLAHGSARRSVVRVNDYNASFFFDPTTYRHLTCRRPVLNVGTGAFTIELSVYLDTYGAVLGGVYYSCFFDNRNAAGMTPAIFLALELIAGPTYRLNLYYGGAWSVLVGGTNVTTGAWHHIAVCGDGAGKMYLCLDGAIEANGAVAYNFNNVASMLQVGTFFDSVITPSTAGRLDGYVEMVRVSNSCLYTAPYVVPGALGSAFPVPGGYGVSVAGQQKTDGVHLYTCGGLSPERWIRTP